MLFWELLIMLALMTPCEAEDSTNCTWVVAEQGNGEGMNFVDLLGIPHYFD